MMKLAGIGAARLRLRWPAEAAVPTCVVDGPRALFCRLADRWHAEVCSLLLPGILPRLLDFPADSKSEPSLLLRRCLGLARRMEFSSGLRRAYVRLLRRGCDRRLRVWLVV